MFSATAVSDAALSAARELCLPLLDREATHSIVDFDAHFDALSADADWRNLQLNAQIDRVVEAL